MIARVFAGGGQAGGFMVAVTEFSEIHGDMVTHGD